jgi:phosphoribosylanthranilate isomerase
MPMGDQVRPSFLETMEFTFNSKSLDRQVSLHEINLLSSVDARKLHAELVIAVQSMDDKVSEASLAAAQSGIPADKDWIHRVKKKRRICVAFATQVKQAIDSAQPATQGGYASIYHSHFDALVRDELGATVYEEIKNEARNLALADLQVPTQDA